MDVYRIQTTMTLAGNLAPELQKILKNMTAVDKAAKGVEKNIGRWAGPIDRAAASVARLSKAMSGIKMPRTALDREMGKWAADVAKATGSMQQMRSTTQGVASAARGVTRSLDGWTSRINAATAAMRRMSSTAGAVSRASAAAAAAGGLGGMGVSGAATRGRPRYTSGGTSLQPRRRGHGRQLGQHEGSHVAGMVGVYGGVNTLEYLVNQGAGGAREDIRAKNAGLTATENARLRAEAIAQSKMYPSLSPLSVREQGRLLIPNVGSYDAAMQVLPEYMKGQVALQTVGGPEEGAKDMEAFARYVDIIGRSMSPSDTGTLIDGYVRARQLDPEAVRSLDYVNAAKSAASPGKALSVGFWSTIAPALFSQQGGARSGTDIASAYQNTVVGRGTAESLFAQNQAGLREGFEWKVGKSGKKQILKKGSLTDETLYNNNPFEWAKKILIPKMAAQGMLPAGYAKGDFSESISDEQRARSGKYLSDLFSNRRGANIFSMMIQDVAQIEQFVKRLGRALGTADVLSDQRRDPYVNFKGVPVQGGRVGTALAEPAMADINGYVSRLSQSLGSLAAVLEKHPVLAQSAFGVGSAAVGGVAAAGITALTLAAGATLSIPAIIVGAGATVTIASALIPWEKIAGEMKAGLKSQFPEWYKENEKSVESAQKGAGIIGGSWNWQLGGMAFEALRGMYQGAVNEASPRSMRGDVQAERARATAGMGVSPGNTQAAIDRLGQTAGPGVQAGAQGTATAVAAEAARAAEEVRRSSLRTAPRMLDAAWGAVGTVPTLPSAETGGLPRMALPQPSAAGVPTLGASGVSGVASEIQRASEAIGQAGTVSTAATPGLTATADGLSKVSGAAQGVPGALESAAGALKGFVSSVMSSLSAAGTAAPPAKGGGAAPGAPAGGGAGGSAPAAPAAPGKQSFAPPPRSGAPIQVTTNLDLDGRSVGRAVTRHQVASAETRNGTGRFDDQSLKTPVGPSSPLVA